VRSRLWDVTAAAAGGPGKYAAGWTAERAAPAGVVLQPNTLYPADLTGNGWISEMRVELPRRRHCDPTVPIGRLRAEALAVCVSLTTVRGS
jgi:hypothetical protein